MEFFGTRKGQFVPAVRDTPIGLEEMLQGNRIAHPTVMMRREALAKIPVLYEEEYIYAEDYKLWLTMLEHGLVLDNLPDVLLRYRTSASQNSTKYTARQQQTTLKIKKLYADKADHNHTVSE
jgi:hypothetical protein